MWLCLLLDWDRWFPLRFVHFVEDKPFFKLVRLLIQEIAAIHKVPRTANIIARENIEVLVVDPPTCFRIFPEEINREYNLTLENMRYM